MVDSLLDYGHIYGEGYKMEKPDSCRDCNYKSKFDMGADQTPMYFCTHLKLKRDKPLDENMEPPEWCPWDGAEAEIDFQGRE